MKILMAAPEVAPYVKVGGLADVLGSLPKALAAKGHDVRVVCPLYGFLKTKGWKRLDRGLRVRLGRGQEGGAGVWETLLPGSRVTVYFLEHGGYYDRHEVYAGPWGDHADNGERFAFLTRAVIDLCAYLDWTPDVFHCHDWTTGLLPVYLNTTERNTPVGDAASVMTIHNLKFQGIFSPQLLDFAGLPWSEFRTDGLECMGQLNMLKGGLYHASKLTTVSPTYAAEIQRPEYGEGMNPVLKFRAADLVGILNGIDAEAWDPANDPSVPHGYSHEDLAGKALCKAALQQELGLEVDAKVPLFAVVSRLYDQKGLDLLAGIMDRLLGGMRIQLAVLGSGAPEIEAAFRRSAERYPGRVFAHIGFDEPLSRRIYAGSDFFLMPSRFEPCGLGQMYAMRYGTPPVVRTTGGLADTVEQYEEGTGRGTGFRFEAPGADALYYTIGWACSTFYDRPGELHSMRLNGMRRDFSWKQSAQKYEQLYGWAVVGRRSGN